MPEINKGRMPPKIQPAMEVGSGGGGVTCVHVYTSSLFRCITNWRLLNRLMLECTTVCLNPVMASW